MSKFFFYTARFSPNGYEWFASGIHKTTDGYFDFVDAMKSVSKANDADVKRVVITFWAETNSIMFGKFNTLMDEIDEG